MLYRVLRPIPVCALLFALAATAASASSILQFEDALAGIPEPDEIRATVPGLPELPPPPLDTLRDEPMDLDLFLADFDRDPATVEAVVMAAQPVGELESDAWTVLDLWSDPGSSRRSGR